MSTSYVGQLKCFIWRNVSQPSTGVSSKENLFSREYSLCVEDSNHTDSYFSPIFQDTPNYSEEVENDMVIVYTGKKEVPPLKEDEVTFSESEEIFNKSFENLGLLNINSEANIQTLSQAQKYFTKLNIMLEKNFILNKDTLSKTLKSVQENNLKDMNLLNEFMIHIIINTKHMDRKNALFDLLSKIEFKIPIIQAFLFNYKEEFAEDFNKNFVRIYSITLKQLNFYIKTSNYDQDIVNSIIEKFNKLCEKNNHIKKEEYKNTINSYYKAKGTG